MAVRTVSEIVFACHSAACAPPPVGTGGSGGGKSGGGARAMTAKYGTRGAGSGGAQRFFPKSTVKGKSAAVQRALADWGKSGRPGDQRDEKATAAGLTAKFGTRRGSQKKKKAPGSTSTTGRKVGNEQRTAQSTLDLTRRFGTRRG